MTHEAHKNPKTVLGAQTGTAKTGFSLELVTQSTSIFLREPHQQIPLDSLLSHSVELIELS